MKIKSIILLFLISNLSCLSEGQIKSKNKRLEESGFLGDELKWDLDSKPFQQEGPLLKANHLLPKKKIQEYINQLIIFQSPNPFYRIKPRNSQSINKFNKFDEILMPIFQINNNSHVKSITYFYEKLDYTTSCFFDKHTQENIEGKLDYMRFDYSFTSDSIIKIRKEYPIVGANGCRIPYELNIEIEKKLLNEYQNHQISEKTISHDNNLTKNLITDKLGEIHKFNKDGNVIERKANLDNFGIDFSTTLKYDELGRLKKVKTNDFGEENKDVEELYFYDEDSGLMNKKEYIAWNESLSFNYEFKIYKTNNEFLVIEIFRGNSKLNNGIAERKIIFDEFDNWIYLKYINDNGIHRKIKYK